MAGRARAGVLAVAALVCGGCATSVGATGSGSLDTSGHGGGEARLFAEAAVGSPEQRAFVSLSAGGGYLGLAQRGVVATGVELGFQGGRAIRFSGGLGYAPRFVVREPVLVAHAGLVSAQVLFRLRPMGGEAGALLLGLRTSAELVTGLGSVDASGTPALIGLFQLGVVVQWLTFDTTGNSWTR